MTTLIQDIYPEVLDMLERAQRSPTIWRSRLPKETQEELEYLDYRFAIAMEDPLA